MFKEVTLQIYYSFVCVAQQPLDSCYELFLCWFVCKQRTATWRNGGVWEV